MGERTIPNPTESNLKNEIFGATQEYIFILIYNNQEFKILRCELSMDIFTLIVDQVLKMLCCEKQFADILI